VVFFALSAVDFVAGSSFAIVSHFEVSGLPGENWFEGDTPMLGDD
jgi:hypothetical protein